MLSFRGDISHTVQHNAAALIESEKQGHGNGVYERNASVRCHL